MLETCPTTGRIIHLPLGTAIPRTASATLLETNRLQLIRLVLPSGKEIPAHLRGLEDSTVLVTRLKPQVELPETLPPA